LIVQAYAPLLVPESITLTETLETMGSSAFGQGPALLSKVEQPSGTAPLRVVVVPVAGLRANGGSPGGAPVIVQLQVPEHELAVKVIAVGEYGTYTVAVVGGGVLAVTIMVAAHSGSDASDVSERTGAASRITCIYTTRCRRWLLQVPSSST
jgi:hypothetical protein